MRCENPSVRLLRSPLRSLVIVSVQQLEAMHGIQNGPGRAAFGIMRFWRRANGDFNALDL